MKKAFVHLLLLCLSLIGVSACADVAASGPLERIHQQGKLRIAMDPSFPPFEEEINGQIQGIDVDLARELGRRLNVEVQFVLQPYDKLYQVLDNQQADLIISALYPEGSTLASYAFSPPYFNAGQLILVRADSTIQAKRDLSGARIAVLNASEGLLEVTRWQYMLNPAPEIVTYATDQEAIAALEQGAVDAFVTHALLAHRARFQSSNLRLLDESVTDEMYVIVARREDEALIKTVADLLEQMKADGSLDTIFRRWVGP